MTMIALMTETESRLSSGPWTEWILQCEEKQSAIPIIILIVNGDKGKTVRLDFGSK